MQEDDSELALQLDDLMAHYQTASGAHEGGIESFTTLWWQIVDEILPALLPVEACKQGLVMAWDPEYSDAGHMAELNRTIAENRARREEEALEKAGYVGPEFEDFRDIIRVHLYGRDWNPDWTRDLLLRQWLANFNVGDGDVFPDNDTS